MESSTNPHQTKVLKGSNALEKLCDECLSLGEKVLIVFSENSVKQSGLYARVVSLLNICGIDHFTYECFGEMQAVDETRNVVALGKNESVQMVLAIGDEDLVCFTKRVAYNFYSDALTPNERKKHLPIINISSTLDEGKKKKLDIADCKSGYAHLKPATLFVDFDF